MPNTSTAIEHAEQDAERIDVDLAGHDPRVQHAVFDLLVDDEEDHRDDPGGRRVQVRRDHADGRAERGADERYEVGDRNEQCQHDRARHAERDQADERGDAGDQADDEVADDVRR